MQSLYSLLFLKWATTKHAGESGVQVSVGVEVEAYGDQAAAASTNFASSLGRSQAGNPVTPDIECHNWQVQTELGF